MTEVVSILSGKGGVGKSIFSLNLATALAKRNVETLLIDFNLSAPSLNLMLGKLSPEANLNQFLKGELNEKDIVYVHPTGLKVIFSSGDELPGESLTSNLSNLIDSLKKYFDYIIIDTSPSLAYDTQVAVDNSNIAIGVSEPTVSSLVNTMRVLKFAEFKDNKVLGLILNKVGLLESEISTRALKEISDYPILAEIAFNNQIQKSELLKHPFVYLYQNHNISTSFFKIASYLLGEKYEEFLEKSAQEKTNKILKKIGFGVKKKKLS